MPPRICRPKLCAVVGRGPTTRRPPLNTKEGFTAAATDDSAYVWDITKVLPPLEPGDAKANWDDLAHSDAMRAYAAYCKMRQAKDASIKVLNEHLKPAAPVSAKQLNELIEKLNSNNFQVREQAWKALHKLGGTAEDALRDARRKNNPLETNRRIDLLIAEIESGGEWRRLVAGVKLLEEYNTPASRAILERLDKNVTHARLVREAEAALRRLREK